MSKRPRRQNKRFDSDPSAANIRDPEQRNDEVERHDTPWREDPTQRPHENTKPSPVPDKHRP